MKSIKTIPRIDTLTCDDCGKYGVSVRVTTRHNDECFEHKNLCAECFKFLIINDKEV